MGVPLLAVSAEAGMFGRQELYQTVRQAHHAPELPPLNRHSTDFRRHHSSLMPSWTGSLPRALSDGTQKLRFGNVAEPQDAPERATRDLFLP